jgi:hypothetical protein
MDYLTLRNNKNLVKGFLKGRIKAMEKQGLKREKIIEFYIDLLNDMKQEEIFTEDVSPEEAEIYLGNGMALVRKIWYKNGIKHTQYGGLKLSNEDEIL